VGGAFLFLVVPNVHVYQGGLPEACRIWYQKLLGHYINPMVKDGIIEFSPHWGNVPHLWALAIITHETKFIKSANFIKY